MDTPEVLETLRTLRAVRQFAERQLEAPVLDAILDTARWTGSAKNTQPWHVVVVQERPVLDELARCGQFADHLRGAPAAVVLVMSDPRRAFDAGRLAQNVMLAAWAQGVGSCIASFFPEDNQARAKELLGVPESKSVSTAISLGYPLNDRSLRVSSWPGASVLPSIGRMERDSFVSWERFGHPR
jgi:nitroreductase